MVARQQIPHPAWGVARNLKFLEKFAKKMWHSKLYGNEYADLRTYGACLQIKQPCIFIVSVELTTQHTVIVVQSIHKHYSD